MIFSGEAGGFMAEFAKLLEDIWDIDYAPIKFEVADGDLLYWSAEIPGKVLAKAYLQGISIKPWARRDLDKNSFESNVQLLIKCICLLRRMLAFFG